MSVTEKIEYLLIHTDDLPRILRRCSKSDKNLCGGVF